MATTIRITSYPWQPDSTKTALRAIGDLGVGLMRDLKTQRGIHTETLMTVLGALAGFAAQRELNERERSRDERRLLTEIKFHTMRILPIRLQYPELASVHPNTLAQYLLYSYPRWITRFTTFCGLFDHQP